MTCFLRPHHYSADTFFTERKYQNEKFFEFKIIGFDCGCVDGFFHSHIGSGFGISWGSSNSITQSTATAGKTSHQTDGNDSFIVAGLEEAGKIRTIQYIPRSPIMGVTLGSGIQKSPR